MNVRYSRWSQNITNQDCERCRTKHPIFNYVTAKGEWIWNVTAAIKAVTERKRPPIAVSKDNLAAILSNYETDQTHLDHVDASIPGIGVPFEDEGVQFMLMIDGGHRAAKSLRDDVEFKIYILTHEEAEECLITSPTKMPAGLIVL